MRHLTALWLLPALCLLAVGCSSESPRQEAQPEEPLVTMAVANLQPKSGSRVSGAATFRDRDDEVTLTIRIEGTPPGVHAVHIHEFGDCSSEDGKSAGGHWNPTTSAHGAWGSAAHHSGDIGNLTVGDDGTAEMVMNSSVWTVGTGADNDVVGRAVIVHAGADDFTTQPTGAAGGRIACGLIELAPGAGGS